MAENNPDPGLPPFEFEPPFRGHGTRTQNIQVSK